MKLQQLLAVMTALVHSGCETRRVLPSEKEVDRNIAIGKLPFEYDVQCEADCVGAIRYILKFSKSGSYVGIQFKERLEHDLLYAVVFEGRGERRRMEDARVHAYVRGTNRKQILIRMDESGYYLEYLKGVSGWRLSRFTPYLSY